MFSLLSAFPASAPGLVSDRHRALRSLRGIPAAEHHRCQSADAARGRQADDRVQAVDSPRRCRGRRARREAHASGDGRQGQRHVEPEQQSRARVRLDVAGGAAPARRRRRRQVRKGHARLRRAALRRRRIRRCTRALPSASTRLRPRRRERPQPWRSACWSYTTTGKYRADNPGDLVDIKATAEGAPVHSQHGGFVRIDERVMRVLVHLIEQGHTIGTSAICSDHHDDGPERPRGRQGGRHLEHRRPGGRVGVVASPRPRRGPRRCTTRETSRRAS